MKRIIFYCILLAVACMIPIRRMDISDLEPIQAVAMSLQDGNVILRTDTGDLGMGKDVKQALERMKQSSEGMVYLDTAQFLVVSENAQEYIGSIKPFLKKSVRVSQWEGGGELSTVAKYMKAHKLGVRLKEWTLKSRLPQLPLILSEKS